MKQLKRYVEERKDDWVFKLKKALYGLKQVLRAWYFNMDQSYLIWGS